MPGTQPPTIALPDPMVRHPVFTRRGRRPVTRNPFVSVAQPAPVAGNPHHARGGGNSDALIMGRRRRHQHHSIGIMSLIRDDDASRQAHRQHHTPRPPAPAQPHLLMHRPLAREYRSRLTSATGRACRGTAQTNEVGYRRRRRRCAPENYGNARRLAQSSRRRPGASECSRTGARAAEPALA